MTFTLTPIDVKNADGEATPMIAYNDGANNAFAHAVVDSTGAIVSPATSGLQTTANSSLATIASNTSGIATAAAQSTGNSSLASVATNTGNINTAIGAMADSAAGTDTGTFSLIAFVKRGLQNWATLLSRTPALGVALAAASSPVVLASDHGALPLPTGAATATGVAAVATEIGKLYQPRSVAATYDGGATMTRPSNTTAYAFGDLVGSDASTASNNKVWVVPFCRAADVPGQITGAKLFKSSTGITNAAFRIYIFRNTFTIAQNDNAAFILPAKADILGILTGSIDEVCADGAYGIFVPKQNVAIPAIPASGTANIFAVVTAVDAYTPVSAEGLSLVLEGFA